MMTQQLTQSKLKTPLGDMIAIADHTHLHLLEFVDRKNIDAQIKKLSDFQIIDGQNSVIESIQTELDDYFKGTLKIFKTPLKLYGSDFQQSVMGTLINVPYGETRAYKDQAIAINNPKASQAVGMANGRNQIAIVVPCHRVIGSNGSLTGYAGGLKRKEWLLTHERKHA